MRLTVALRPLAALALTAAIIALVVKALGASPLEVFGALLDGAVGNWIACTDTLVKATPLLFCGLAIAIAFEGSLWNIGADGQLTVGAIAAGAIGPGLERWPHLPAIAVMLTIGAIAGAVWGALAGWLRARRDVNEVISTIMLNFTALQLLAWTVHGPLMEASGAFPKSAAIAPSATLRLYFPPSRLNCGMILGVLLAGGCYWFLFHSAAGFKLRALGRNRYAGIYFGLSATRVTIATMALSGALAGLGGAVQIAAITHRLYEKISPGWGYEAIAVALVARLNPLAIIPAAVLFGALDNGAQAVQRTAGISPVLVQVIEALVIMLLLAFDSAAFRNLRDAWTSAPGTVAGDELPAGEGDV